MNSRGRSKPNSIRPPRIFRRPAETYSDHRRNRTRAARESSLGGRLRTLLTTPIRRRISTMTATTSPFGSDPPDRPLRRTLPGADAPENGGRGAVSRSRPPGRSAPVRRMLGNRSRPAESWWRIELPLPRPPHHFLILENIIILNVPSWGSKIPPPPPSGPPLQLPRLTPHLGQAAWGRTFFCLDEMPVGLETPCGHGFGGSLLPAS